jgi:hypothetical protein
MRFYVLLDGMQVMRTRKERISCDCDTRISIVNNQTGTVERNINALTIE